MYKVSSIVCIGIKKGKQNKTKAACWVSDMFAALAKRQLSCSEKLQGTHPHPAWCFYTIVRGHRPSCHPPKPAGLDLKPALCEAGVHTQPDLSSRCDRAEEQR